MMDKETIEKIFNLGADALYNTLDPNTGECDDRFGKLREEAVKLFSIPVVRESLTGADLLDIMENIEIEIIELKEGGKGDNDETELEALYKRYEWYEGQYNSL